MQSSFVLLVRKLAIFKLIAAIAIAVASAPAPASAFAAITRIAAAPVFWSGCQSGAAVAAAAAPELPAPRPQKHTQTHLGVCDSLVSLLVGLAAVCCLTRWRGSGCQGGRAYQRRQ